MKGSACEERPRLIGDHHAVDDWFPEGAALRLDDLLSGLRESGQHRITRRRPHAPENVPRIGAAKGRGEGNSLGGALCAVSPTARRVGALDDCAMEKLFAARRDEMQAGTLSAGGCPRDCDVPRISAESSDVVSNPPQRGLLVQQPVIAG